MKILLDENIDVNFRHLLIWHDVFTVDFMGWKGIRNGDLLRAAIQDKFDAVLTMDKTIPKEQYLQQFDIILAILSPAKNTPNYIKELAPIILDKLPTAKKGKAVIISGQ